MKLYPICFKSSHLCSKSRYTHTHATVGVARCVVCLCCHLFHVFLPHGEKNEQKSGPTFAREVCRYLRTARERSGNDHLTINGAFPHERYGRRKETVFVPKSKVVGTWVWVLAKGSSWIHDRSSGAWCPANRFAVIRRYFGAKIFTTRNPVARAQYRWVIIIGCKGDYAHPGWSIYFVESKLIPRR